MAEDYSWRGSHRPGAPDDAEEGTAAPAHALDKVYPSDVYTHPHYYGGGEGLHGGPKAFRETVNTLRGIRGKPDAPVTIYRSLPKEHADKGFHTGDWVSVHPSYAQGHGLHETDPSKDWPVIKATVPAKHLWNNGDSLDEFGYHGPPIKHEGVMPRQASLIDDYRWDRDAQDQRAEKATKGYSRETDSYYGRDHEGNGQEKRINYKDYLRQHKAPEEEDYDSPGSRDWYHGSDLGAKHRLNPTNQDHEEFNAHADRAEHVDHFVRGYSDGWENAMPENTRVAVLHGSQDADMPVGLTVIAHVSGNSVNILHCPFCGSGAVIGRSDGTVECGYCTSVFTVQVQPAYNGFPQSVDGQAYPWPGAPDPGDVLAPQAPGGTNLAPGVQDPNAAPPFGEDAGSSDPAEGGDPDADPDAEGDDDKPAFLKGKDDKKSDSKDDKKKSGNPFAKKKSYLAVNGAELPVDEFLAHLSVVTAKDKSKAAQTILEARRRGEL